MNQNPQYNALKVLILIALVGAVGYFIVKNSRTGADTASVIAPQTTVVTGTGENASISIYWYATTGNPCNATFFSGPNQTGEVIGWGGGISIFGSPCILTWINPATSLSSNTGQEGSSPVHNLKVGANASGTLAVSGDNAAEVLQFKLFMLGTTKILSGKMDLPTTNAIRGFQSLNKLKETGTLTPETVKAIEIGIGKISVVAKQMTK